MQHVNQVISILSQMYFVKNLVSNEIRNPKDQSVYASPQAWMYFNPGSQTTLQHMLSDWARVQRSTVGQHDDVKKLH